MQYIPPGLPLHVFLHSTRMFFSQFQFFEFVQRVKSDVSLPRHPDTVACPLLSRVAAFARSWLDVETFPGVISCGRNNVFRPKLYTYSTWPPLRTACSRFNVPYVHAYGVVGDNGRVIGLFVENFQHIFVGLIPSKAYEFTLRDRNKLDTPGIARARSLLPISECFRCDSLRRRVPSFPSNFRSVSFPYILRQFSTLPELFR